MPDFKKAILTPQLARPIGGEPTDAESHHILGSYKQQVIQD